jgi:hypothetical protein
MWSLQVLCLDVKGENDRSEHGHITCKTNIAIRRMVGFTLLARHLTTTSPHTKHKRSEQEQTGHLHLIHSHQTRQTCTVLSGSGPAVICQSSPAGDMVRACGSVRHMELYGRIGGINCYLAEKLDLLNLIFPMYFPSTISYLEARTRRTTNAGKHGNGRSQLGGSSC